MTTTAPSPPTYPLTRPGRKAKRDVEETEPGKKPKKVNSEIRKQQNRIASRNYREKRKQKLQYLQRLLRDQDPADEQQHDGSPSESSHDGRERSGSADYHAQRPIASSEILPSNVNFSPLPPSTRSMAGSVVVPSATYSNLHLASTQPFPNLDSAWSTSMYEPQPPVHISAWNLPHWMPSLDFNPQMPSTTEDFQFTPPHTQQVYQQLPTPPQQPIEPVSNADLFILGSYTHCQPNRNQAQGKTNSMMIEQHYNPLRRAVYI